MIGRREFITLLGSAAWAYGPGELALSSNSLVFFACAGRSHHGKFAP
jgi:hypothetical protein